MGVAFEKEPDRRTPPPPPRPLRRRHSRYPPDLSRWCRGGGRGYKPGGSVNVKGGRCGPARRRRARDPHALLPDVYVRLRVPLPGRRYNREKLECVHGRNIADVLDLTRGKSDATSCASITV